MYRKIVIVIGALLLLASLYFPVKLPSERVLLLYAVPPNKEIPKPKEPGIDFYNTATRSISVIILTGVVFYLLPPGAKEEI